MLGVGAVVAGCEVVTGLTDAHQAPVKKDEASVAVYTAPVDADVDAAQQPPSGDAGFNAEHLVVASLGNHTCAVGPDHRAYCWGDNSEGQLGDGTTEQRNAPVLAAPFDDVVDVSAGYTHSCLVRGNDAGDVYCWGKNERGQLGDGTKVDRHQATRISTSYARKVGVAGWHTCILTQIGGVRCWGDNYYGALGDGTFTASTSYVDVRGLANVSFLSVGVMHNCAATAQGKVYCWGRAFFGETGYKVDGGNGSPDPSDPGSPNATPIAGLTDIDEIASGEDHSCAIRATDGAIFCWGRNDYAEYGGGTGAENGIPPFRLTGLTYPHHLAAGRFTTCGIFKGQGVQCWGDNNYGQRGTGNTAPFTYAPSPPVNGLANVFRISTGEHTCAWQYTAGQGPKLFCWGRNDLGQLGIGHVSDYELTPQEVQFPSPQVDP